MYRVIVSLCVLVAISGSIACVDSEGDDDSDHRDKSITEAEDVDKEDTDVEDGDVDPAPDDEHDIEVITGDERGATSIAGVRLRVFDRFLEEFVLVLDTSLEEQTVPLLLVDVLPLAEGSRHFYAETFLAFEPGAYDVEAFAIDERGRVIDECSPAIARGVRGSAAGELETLLLIQCDPSVGIARHLQDGEPEVDAATDFLPPDTLIYSIAVINYAPQIETVEVHPSTTLKCPATVELCATVVEPDRDPVVFDWNQLEGPSPLAGPSELRFHEEEGVTEKCVEYELADEDAHYVFALDVLDRLVEDGAPVNIETWYRREGYGDIESRDSATVSFDVQCPKEKKLPDEPKDDKTKDDETKDDKTKDDP